jgi:DNA-binding Lrp family transcriptional regulator
MHKIAAKTIALSLLLTTSAARSAPTTPWWQTALLYEIYPRSFADSNGDGIGDLKGIAARLPHVAGLGADAIWISPFFAKVKLNAHGRANLDEFAQAIRSFPEVLEAYVLMGVFDFMLRIVAADIDAYERFFFTKLSKLPGIQEINSTVALSEVKATTALPID